jgi:hypothetical protein
MPTLTLRRLSADVKSRLKSALASQEAGPRNLAESIRARFASLGGVDLPDLPREPMRRPPRLAK